MADNLLKGTIKIDAPGFKETVSEIDRGLAKVGNTAAATAPKIKRVTDETTRLANQANDKFRKSINDTNSALNQEARTIENLRTKLATLQNQLTQITGAGRIAATNREIEKLENEIGRMSNAGKVGFDDLGNAIGRTTTPINKAFAGVRQLANILPGVGIAGLIAFATEPIIDFVSGLLGASNATKRLQEHQEKLAEAINEARQSAEAEIATIRSLVDVARDEAQSKDIRTAAIQKLNQEYPALLGNLTLENIGTQKVTRAIDDLNKALIAKSITQVYADKIAEQSIKKEEAQRQRIEKLTAIFRLEKQLTELASKGTARPEAFEGLSNQINLLREQYNDLGVQIIESDSAMDEMGDSMRKAQVDALKLTTVTGPVSGSLDSLRDKLKGLKEQYDSTGDAAQRAKLVPEIKSIESQIKKLEDALSIRQPGRQKGKELVIKIPTRAELQINILEGISEKDLQEDLLKSFGPLTGVGKGLEIDISPSLKGLDSTLLIADVRKIGETIAPIFGQIFSNKLESALRSSIQLSEEQLTGLAQNMALSFSLQAEGINILTQSFEGFSNAIFEGQNVLKGFSNAAIGALKSLAAQLVKTVVLATILSVILKGAGATGSFGQIFGAAFKGILGFNKGGKVPGSGNTDTVPAILTPGEFVIPKDKVDKWLGIINLFESGKIPRFNLGGMVGNFSIPSFASQRMPSSKIINNVNYGGGTLQITGQLVGNGDQLVAVFDEVVKQHGRAFGK